MKKNLVMGVILGLLVVAIFAVNYTNISIIKDLEAQKSLALEKTEGEDQFNIFKALLAKSSADEESITEFTIIYDITTPTREDVTATITFENENIVITNNENSNTYTFSESGSFTFEFEDEEGNTGTAVATVDWIYKEAPKATIEYSIETLTNQDVIATITFERENVEVTDGDKHTFTENGEYTFEFVDEVGNTGTKVAKVDWIDKEAPEATIEYSTTEPTNQDVIATITFNEENVEVKESIPAPQMVSTFNEEEVEGGIPFTHTFTENGEYTFEFRDAAGNEGTAVAKVDWIDKEAPEATIEYSIETLTNQDVVATIKFDEEGVTVKEGNTHTFTENGEYTFEFTDRLGNEGTKLAKVDWIDKKVPEATIEYSTTEPTNQDVEATITFDKEEVTVKDGEKHTFTENGEYTFEFEDKLGNAGTAIARVNWIYKEAPEATIEYSIETLTNQDVIATITFERENVEVEGGNTHTFTENGVYEFKFVDEVGNEGTAEAKVDWIDKEAPEATIEYSTIEETNQDVEATITFNEENVEVTDGNKHIFTENGEYTFEFTDAAGNTGTKIAKVDWIDKEAPEGKIEYSITNPTNQDVEATITFDEEGVTVTDGDTHTFTENGEYIFEFTDRLGNEGTAVAKVDWIYKGTPEGKIEYSITTLTNQDVVATITFERKNVEVTDGNEHTFTENGEYTFEFVDAAGNEGTLVAKVDWIDKVAPKATVEYDITDETNKDVVATVTFDKEDVEVTDGNTHTFTENGEYTFEFVDKAGNTGTAVAKVEWIDKKVPEATIEYSITTLTNQDVVATISFDKEDVTVTDGDTHTFTENGEYTFEFVDKLGNAGTAVAKVDWIDKVAPKGTIEYSIETLTNQDVIATITFDKENVEVKDGNTHIFEENGEYEFEFVDKAGNTGTLVATVDWIDKKVPEATIEYNIETLTNQDVIATVTFDKEEVAVKDGNTHTFTENGEYTFEFVDKIGNAGTAVAKVDWIDKVAPKATITYDITTPTEEDVIATISFDKEEVTILNNEGNDTYTFIKNGTFTFEFIDKAGNTGTAEAKVDWIEKEAKITYDIETLTNQDVTATVTFKNEDITILNNDGNNTYTFEENGAFTFVFEDSEGNRGIITARVNWIDKVEPKATIEYSIETLTNQDVEATITFDKENVEVKDGNKHTFTENGEYTFEFADKAGNTGTAVAKVDWIDKVVPEATIEYSITEETNQDVVATVTFDKENVEVKDGNEHTFTENGEYTFEFVDEAGNTGTVEAKVDWIDKKVPEATIEYSITDPTNQDVEVTVTFDKEEVTILNNEGNNTYTFEENGEFTFEFTDKLGNAGTAVAKVDWIYKGIPEGKIEYSIATLTNQDVIATITFDRENVEVKDGNTHTFTENGEYTFEFSDPAGNEGTLVAKVDWIDKKAPEATIEYSITEPTNQDVIATITFDKENVEVKDGNTHTFTENGEYIFEFTDAAGNAGTAKATVNWIYKGTPKATIKYSTETLTNQDVVATITFDRENVTVLGGNTHTFTENGEYIFEFEDIAGNKGTAEAKVDWIDKVAPKATIEYSTEELTNQDVIATVKFDKEDVDVKDGNEHTFTENGEYTFEFEDKAGNKGTAVAKVDWIDKEAPEATIEYSITEPTNQDVVATVKFDEEDVEVTGGNTYTFTENGEYTFKFADKLGNEGTAVAKVDWIDKVAPKATIEYSTTTLTNQDVTVTIIFDKDNVIVTGGNTYTFTENGEYTFEFVDGVGNKGTAVAKVDWIDKGIPTAKIEYSTTEVTTNPVIAKLVNPSKEITVINNGGKDTYTFKKNGTFTFIIEDKAGNRSEVTATVTWIGPKDSDNKITSNVYKVQNEYVKKINQDTKISDFKKNIDTTAEEIIIKEKNGDIAKEDAILKTGMKVCVGTGTYTVVVTGDMDGNGKITINDLAKLCLHYIEIENLVSEYKEAADIDDNQKITVNDLAKLQLILIGQNK